MSGNYLATTDILDLDTREWFTAGEMNQARDAPQMAVLGNKVFVLGGRDRYGNDLSTIEELSLEDWTWSMMDEEMREKRAFFSAVVIPEIMVLS